MVEKIIKILYNTYIVNYNTMLRSPGYSRKATREQKKIKVHAYS